MILVAGSANLDFVVRAPHIPAPGETVLGRDFKIFPGGKGANQAVACARAGGAATHMLLALGDDAFAVPLEAALAAAEVQMHVVRVKGQASGTAFICVSDDAQNAITVAPGANLNLRAADLPPLDHFSYLMMQLEIPMETVDAYARAAHAKGVKVVLNAAPAQALPLELLALIDVLIVNEGELTVVSQCQGSIAQCLTHLTVPCVVVTLGQHGCCARVNNHYLFQSAFAVTPVDTTAAGDTFCGVLVAALSQGRGSEQSLQQSLPSALRQACAAGALACTRLGAQSSIPRRAEVSAYLARQTTPDEPTNNANTGTTANDRNAALRQFCGF